MSVTHQDDAGYYRYRGMPKPDPAARQADKLRRLLKANRQRIAFNASSSRPLSVRLNQHIAQARTKVQSHLDEAKQIQQKLGTS